jgi:hypothetical protein
MIRGPILVGLLVAGLTACGGDDDDGGGLGALDPRCEALCADGQAACSGDVAACQTQCQVRVAGLASLCASCLLQDMDTGACLPGALCCPDPAFPRSVLDCADVCADSAGVNPSGDHPICVEACSSSDPDACTVEITQCLSDCRSYVAGVSGLCALCLLEGADGGACASEPCCPDLELPAAVNDCAAFCG